MIFRCGLGDEPYSDRVPHRIVDTGNELSRTEWMEAAFSIVEPDDVRWVFLSHDDHDHSGNLEAALAACPNATLVTTHFTIERVVRAMELPMHRMRWINASESFDAGDRTLVAGASADLRLARHARPVRHQHRGPFGRSTRSPRACRSTSSTSPIGTSTCGRRCSCCSTA